MTTPNQARRPQRSRPAAQPPPLPAGPGVIVGQPVAPVDWFRRMPNGGTVYLKPAERRAR